MTDLGVDEVVHIEELIKQLEEDRIKDDEEMYDSIEQIYFQELRSVEEVTQLL